MSDDRVSRCSDLTQARGESTYDPRTGNSIGDTDKRAGEDPREKDQPSPVSLEQPSRGAKRVFEDEERRQAEQEGVDMLNKD